MNIETQKRRLKNQHSIPLKMTIASDLLQRPANKDGSTSL